MVVRNTVREAVTKTVPKKFKTAKWLSEEALQTAEERREVTGKGEREAIQLHAELQRTARRCKEAFLSEQRKKDTEENKRMGKTRDLLKKTGDTKGTLHANK